jgi:hypothetical protein
VKGVVIANCGNMGLNWERLSLSGYVEAMNAQSDETQGKPQLSEGFKRFTAAHGLTGNA